MTTNDKDQKDDFDRWMESYVFDFAIDCSECEKIDNPEAEYDVEFGVYSLCAEHIQRFGRDVFYGAKSFYTAECILALHQEAEKMSREAAKMVFGALLALPTMDPDSKEFQALYKRLTGLPFKG